MLILGLLIVVVVSAGFEALFIDRGINVMDEGWPLHAAMEMHDGKTLYDEVFWVFPPGHVLPAWMAYALDPPGLIAARTIYAVFSVAMVVAMFFLARQLMPADFAILAALLVAIAAPRSHGEHLLFGYRYLVWSILVLLCFQRRLEKDDVRWLFAAGVFAGIALFFRLTPAFAVSVGVGVGILASSREWRAWIRDGLWYSAGLVLVWIPVLLWFHHSVGLETFWVEMVVRPVEMTGLQSKPVPPLPELTWARVRLGVFVALLGFRAYLVLYVALLGALIYRWGRAWLSKRPFDDVLLLSFVVFGAVYFSRSYGRADIPHLDSAIPPVAFLLAFCTSLLTRIPKLGLDRPGARAALFRGAICVMVFASWCFVNGSDRYLNRDGVMGNVPVAAAGGRIKMRPGSVGQVLDRVVPAIWANARPEDTILVMTHAPLLYVLSDRHSPGFNDFVMPGVFRTSAAEKQVLDIVRASPPAVVVWPTRHFDRMESRGINASAPSLGKWVKQNYRRVLKSRDFLVMKYKGHPGS